MYPRMSASEGSNMSRCLLVDCGESNGGSLRDPLRFACFEPLFLDGVSHYLLLLMELKRRNSSPRNGIFWRRRLPLGIHSRWESQGRSGAHRAFYEDRRWRRTRRLLKLVRSIHPCLGSVSEERPLSLSQKRWSSLKRTPRHLKLLRLNLSESVRSPWGVGREALAFSS